MKTMIAIPCMGDPKLEFTQSLLWLEKGENVSINFKPNSLIYDSRNLISLTAIEHGFDRVMWFDADMVFNPDTMKRLQHDMDVTQAEMVTGIYFKRGGKPTPVFYDELDPPGFDENKKPVSHIHDYVDYPRDTIFPVKGCGFGCVLTTTKLLKEVWDKFGPAFQPFPWASEDIAFCYRVNQLGHTIYCDSRVKCGHVGTFIYTEDTFLQMRGEKN